MRQSIRGEGNLGMAKRKYSIGVDFGTESGRALLVDVSNGKELATAIYPYKNGVIDEKLPGTNVRLEPDWATISSMPTFA